MMLRIKWKEAHHLYIGAILFLGCPVFVILGMDETLAFCIAMAGFWLVIDDGFQHWRQMFEPEYRSPGHRLFQWLWHKVFGSWWPFGKLK